MRRKPGALRPIEEKILHLGAESDDEVDGEFYAFSLAKRLQALDNAGRLISYGTLYKTMRRMESAGLLTSRWEDPELAEEAGRPRRRLYRLTDIGRAGCVAPIAEKLAARRPKRTTQPGLTEL